MAYQNKNDDPDKIELAGIWRKDGEYGPYYAGPVRPEALERLGDVGEGWEVRLYKNQAHERNAKAPSYRIVLVRKKKKNWKGNSRQDERSSGRESRRYDRRRDDDNGGEAPF